MAIQDTFKGKNQTYTNDIVEFSRGGIESKNHYCFIPYGAMTRISLGQLAPTFTWKTILGIIIAFVGLALLFIGKWWSILFGLAAIVVGIIIVLRSLKSWYALNIDMASGAVYSFIADSKEFTDKGYRLIVSMINEREENRKGGTYNFINGTFG